MQIRLLGPVEASLDGRPVALGPPQQRGVLAMLALHVNRTVSTDRLIEGLWGERAPRSAHKLVQLYVSHLRKLLSHCEAEIVTHGRGYELQLSADHVDTARFQRLVDEAAHTHCPSDGEAREALGLWRGGPLTDVADEPFAGPEIRRLEQLRVHAAELAIGADLEAGRHHEVIDELAALVTAEPLREQLHAQHMLALYRSGRQAEALKNYREVREMLVEQIGVEPGPDLQRLHAAILSHDPELDPAEASRLPPELDARTPMAGRHAELDCLRQHWRQAQSGRRRVVLVTGARGIGKTRLAAELAGELHTQRIRTVYVGASAAGAAAAVDRAGRVNGPGLIVVDELERASAETVRGAAGLAAGARESSLLVVLAYRDDPPPALVTHLARELEQEGAAHLALGPLAADAVREISVLAVAACASMSTSSPGSGTRVAVPGASSASANWRTPSPTGPIAPSARPDRESPQR